MGKIDAEKSWVPKSLLRIMLIVWVIITLCTVLFYQVPFVSLIGGMLSGITLLISLLFCYAYYKLSQKGGDVQGQISSFVTTKIDSNAKGKLLDIGCGSGILSVELSLKCPGLSINGIDYWGSMWGFSKEKCEMLAKEHNVSDRVRFERASASSLPFDDESFDIVISNMVFHEVADAKDKREVIKEALRVLKKGGQFVFQDLLLSEKLYGKPDDLVNYIRSLGIESVSLDKTKDHLPIPSLLRNMFFGNAARLSGIR